ncbi:hypothetical protein [Streptomyces sp. NPDC057966]|uniref:hypothetical protein n=1 Tax=Streptomyces sp. NPDC057966 TaxID=3346292 RepID=UPI0036EA6AC0
MAEDRNLDALGLFQGVFHVSPDDSVERPKQASVGVVAPVAISAQAGVCVLACERVSVADRQTEDRRGRYFAALSKARNDFRALARDLDTALPQRDVSARISFAPCYEFRHQVAITASVKVVAASEKTFRRLRHIRDLAGAGTLAGDGRYSGGRRENEDVLAELRTAMRQELGSDEPD